MYRRKVLATTKEDRIPDLVTASTERNPLESRNINGFRGLLFSGIAKKCQFLHFQAKNVEQKCVHSLKSVLVRLLLVTCGGFT